MDRLAGVGGAGPAPGRRAGQQRVARSAPHRPPGSSRLCSTRSVQPLAAASSGPSCCRSVGADPDAPLPVADRPRRRRSAARLPRPPARGSRRWDVCDPEPIEAMPQVAGRTVRPGRRHPRGGPGDGPRQGRRRTRSRPAWPSSGWASAGPRSSTTSATSTCCSSPNPCWTTTAQPLITSEQAVSVATRMAAELTRVCSASHRGRDDLGGRRRPAAGGQGRSARPDAVQPPHLLRALGEDLGVPGHAQVPTQRRRPGSGQDFVDMVAPMVWRAPSGRTSSPTRRRCASG